ncbi:MAG: hypothetical protein CL920_20175 [Deltaproteobacteria bacterium]|nr:hypothetical protein [Deltaproteobacteria bacterium]MBU51009.1 hypothetical protein [Deltaproteobacteria bacterium]
MLATSRACFCLAMLLLLGLGTTSQPVFREAHARKKRRRSSRYWRKRRREWKQIVRLQKLSRKEGDILDALEALDRKRLAVMAKLQTLQRRVNKQRKELKAKQRQARLQQELCAKMMKQLQPRLRLFYRISRLGHARWLSGTRSLKEMALRWSAVRLMTTRDIRYLKRYQAARHVALKQLKEVKERQRALNALISRHESQRDTLHTMRKEKKLALSVIYKEARLYKRILRQVRGSGRKINRMFSGLRSVKGLRVLDKLKGKLPWPIMGFSPYCHRYRLKWVGSFASLSCQQLEVKQRSLRGPLGRTGVTLVVPEGAPVIAVADGKIVHQGWMRGYGKLILINHGHRFYSLYAHLSRFALKKGERVRMGQALGLTGSTGRLGGPALYFEIRHMARSVRPEEWLRPVRAPRK